ncbi:hypothetical protein [Actinospica sp.]|uniref:hypothetical protein n=1 Tax=Actinospica sp. TaxID=1872142 RepID=UPI002CA2FA83|nr:hypothetical protein [Actinospica sp.]HWG22508.1 hypothetical protein [Actinospica sp.]
MTLPANEILHAENYTENYTDEDTDTAAELRQKHEESIADNFRHIVCFLCYPAFATTRVAPHDAECICGKPVRTGDIPGPSTAPECVLCNEMAEGHRSATHAET